VEDDSSSQRFSPEEMQSLRLPGMHGDAALASAFEIDEFLKSDERPLVSFMPKLEAHREAGLSHLLTMRGTHATIDIELFLWPASLFIPGGASSHDYWFTPAPDDHRYALEWTAPASATANQASRQNGTLFAFGQLLNERPQETQSSESGVGIFYKPSMTLGVVDLQPRIDCSGTLRTFFEFFPLLAAGYVEVRAELLLACWQQIPGGFDLMGFKQFDVATSGRRDQSFGPELQNFQRSFAGTSLSAPFVVQKGRTYLFGVVSRIIVTSTLTSNTGAPLPMVSSSLLRVWGSINCVIPQIDVLTKRVDIP
jgi:hypothetical protein